MASSASSEPAPSNTTVRIPKEEMEAVFYETLLKYGFEETKAQLCSRIFMENSIYLEAFHKI